MKYVIQDGLKFVKMKYYKSPRPTEKEKHSSLYWHNHEFIVSARPKILLKGLKHINHDGTSQEVICKIPKPYSVTIRCYLSKNGENGDFNLEGTGSVSGLELVDMFDVAYDDLGYEVKNHIKEMRYRISIEFEPLGYNYNFPDIPDYDEELKFLFEEIKTRI